MNYACQESKRGRARNIDRRNAALCICEISRKYSQQDRERDRKNGTRDKKNSSQITAITFVYNFIINEESKNDITYECGKEFREKLKFFQFVYPLSNSIFIRQRDRV